MNEIRGRPMGGPLFRFFLFCRGKGISRLRERGKKNITKNENIFTFVADLAAIFHAREAMGRKQNYPQIAESIGITCFLREMTPGRKKALSSPGTLNAW